MIDIPRIFTISESEHRIHNPFTPEKYATLGRALRMAPGTTILDLGSGSGEMLCSWARDHQIVGTGVDMSLRQQLTTAPLHHVTWTREYLGWGVFVLMAR